MREILEALFFYSKTKKTTRFIYLLGLGNSYKEYNYLKKDVFFDINFVLKSCNYLNIEAICINYNECSIIIHIKNKDIQENVKIIDKLFEFYPLKRRNPFFCLENKEKIDLKKYCFLVKKSIKHIYFETSTYSFYMNVK